MTIVPNWHPIWIHFTIGLLIAATVLYTLAFAFQRCDWSQPMHTTARWNLLIGAVFAMLSLLSGYLAAGSVAHDDAGHANMLLHRNWALITSGFFLLAAAIGGLAQVQDKPRLSVLLLMLCGAAALTVTGYKGAANVYEHGLGVQRLPDAGHHHHAGHAHANPQQ